ncbi:hypothetical protein SAMD00019534_068050 [Acytostelium subglobosum LB1]|uniref:hypothetical protein n=1 Tax=Acytostelium subglobosum LB1 TaxID=1410327 RepID=UPI0006451FE7|nr:hypothetical protein SAMD00019534_068050 [Acytostelium subglobosum LB1]GAM23630.1 hypothetical protein SAMD00019534_068050 [Acytostelium subglobosum LB1]|eukprot:XP_012753371.1 hypothetical protein SAMD00019534_068050 [Acytostelium subglobosum LB1]
MYIPYFITLLMMLLLLLLVGNIEGQQQNSGTVFRTLKRDEQGIIKHIDDEYNKLYSSLTWKYGQGYECIHDRIMERHKRGITFDNTETPLHSQSQSHATSSVGAYGATRSPIRILFNTTYIQNTNDVYACHNVGQLVFVSSSDSVPTDDTADCSGTGTESSCTYLCRMQDLLTDDLSRMINGYLLPSINQVLTDLIMVAPSDKLVFNAEVYKDNHGQCDYGIDIPLTYTTLNGAKDGVDLIVWVTARPTVSNSTIAYAIVCNYPKSRSGVYGRPYGANINFNPIYFSRFIGQSNISFTFNEFVRVGIHEMTHALGFSGMFYNSFIYNNNPYTASASVTRTGNTPSGSSYTYRKSAITSQAVVGFVQKHYNCSLMDYAELEDSGSTSTAGSHWEKRMANEEYMIGFVSPIAPITNLTLALLQDTGWYTINRTDADKLVWGRNAGCDFTDNCYIDTWNYQGYFCTKHGDQSCTATRMGKGICLINSYSSNLPGQFQHFTSARVGGQDSVSDFCPFYQVYGTLPNTYYCTDQDNQDSANLRIFEVYGANSRCFEYNISSTKTGMACWEQRCNGTKVEIKVGSIWVHCNNPGEQIVVNGVNLICPQGFAECGATPLPIKIQPWSGSSPSTAQMMSNSALILLITLTTLMTSLLM